MMLCRVDDLLYVTIIENRKNFTNNIVIFFFYHWNLCWLFLYTELLISVIKFGELVVHNLNVKGNVSYVGL